MTTISALKKSDTFNKDRLWLNGEELSVDKSQRVKTVLREMRKRATRFSDAIVHIVSANSFPTAAGLASSAAGYAALTIALADVFGVPLNADLTTVARMGSGSACRSLYGGLVAWNAGKKADGTDSVAVKIAPRSSWLDITILVLNDEKKHTSSTSGMVRSVDTSDLLRFRAKHVVSPRIEEMSKAFKSQNFETFGTLMMRDSNQFHATCLDTYPPVFYLTDDSRKVINFVHTANEKAGRIRAAYTFDAGPNAVIFTQSKDTESFLNDLQKHFQQQKYQGVIKNVLNTRIGDGPRKMDKLSLIDSATLMPKKNYSSLI